MDATLSRVRRIEGTGLKRQETGETLTGWKRYKGVESDGSRRFAVEKMLLEFGCILDANGEQVGWWIWKIMQETRIFIRFREVSKELLDFSANLQGILSLT